jgi:hypothetical protein
MSTAALPGKINIEFSWLVTRAVDFRRYCAPVKAAQYTRTPNLPTTSTVRASDVRNGSTAMILTLESKLS